MITSNLWIFILMPTMQGSAITMICPDIVTSSSPFQHPFHILRLPQICSATPRYFHLPPPYEDHMMTIHVSLNKANLNAINLTTPNFHIWQHFGSNWTTAYIQKLVDIPEIPIMQLISTWLARVNLSYHLRSAETQQKDPVLHGSS